MNKERLLRLADRIETATDFNMRDYHYCFAGQTIAEFKPEPVYNPITDALSRHNTARRALDLTKRQSEDLFTPSVHLWRDRGINNVHAITNKQGAAVLRHFAATEKVDFSICQ
jgi:hypothetical protein